MTRIRSAMAAARTVLRGGLARYATRGPSEVTRLESELSARLGAGRVLCVNSGTSALICALVGAGIGPGDEVLVPAYTWVSTAAAVLAVGAMPVLVEIDTSLTIDVADARRKLSPHTRAIMPVHMLNLVCDMDGVMALAREHGLVVIEDACQSVGVSYRGRRTGTIGDAGVLSFQQHKNIQSGEGGALLTADARIHARARMYHDVGSYIRTDRVETDEPLLVGMNYRMPELAAAVLRPQLRVLDRRLAGLRRRRAYVLDRLSHSRTFRVQPSPHHDPASAVGLVVTFDDVETATAFASVPGIDRLIDTGRHVYTNWEPLITRQPPHPRLDPYAWAPRPMPALDRETCPRTLAILERTCKINLVPDLPSLAYRLAVSRMVR